MTELLYQTDAYISEPPPNRPFQPTTARPRLFTISPYTRLAQKIMILLTSLKLPNALVALSGSDVCTSLP
jgi:hypothetical protein